MSESQQSPNDVPPRIYAHEFMAMKRTKRGVFLYNVHDAFIGRSLDQYGQWCEGELELLGHFLRPGDVVLDVGANVGTHTVFFAQQVTDEGCVFAFEPQRLVFQNLCANLALNALVNVIALQHGVGSRREMVALPVIDPRRDGNFGSTRLRGHERGEPVQVIRIDDLRLARCNLIKVDVEGMECEVLEGARETIAAHRPVLFVENNSVEHSRATIAAIDGLGYEAYWHVCPYFDADNYFQTPENLFARYRPETNLLCFHRSCRTDIRGLPKITGLEDNCQRLFSRLREND